LPGEAVGLIGVNGAGKSTLLKLITGIAQPTGGNIQTLGKIVAMLELGMGFHPDFSGRQNVYMAGQLLGMSNKEISQVMADIEKFAEIGDYIDLPVRIYSSGMQVRLAFSVATAIRPDILIVDEALSVGDAYFQQKCFLRIREFQEEGTTLLLVSHDLAAISSFCEKVIWLDNGTLKAYGECKEILESYAESIYSRKQQTQINKLETKKIPVTSHRYRDMRLDFVAQTNLRNDINVFELKNTNRSWGDSKVRISNVSFQDSEGALFTWIVGGEKINLVINIEARDDVKSIIVGFLVKNKFGQNLFGDNTFISQINNPLDIYAEDCYSITFVFNMPIMPVGIYTITTAVVTGSQQDYVVLDWKDDAIRFESQNSWSNSGLVGVPMDKIKIHKINEDL
jgi:lipopolysaccharide transport system ATP-binding protein